MLAVSTILASLAALASIGVSSGCSAATPTAGGRFCPSSTDAYASTVLVCCCAPFGMASSVAGGGLMLLSIATPTVS
jgi:hypothetical protein